MSYNVFVSRYSNNDKIIKNSFSRKTSLAMSAYISDQLRYDHQSKKIYNPKKGRDISEVSFSALILPKDIPDNHLKELLGQEDTRVHRVRDRFTRSSGYDYQDNIIIRDAEVISHFWQQNDLNIASVETDTRIVKNSRNKLRLYNLYLFSSPVAHKHFPKEMEITHHDLRAIDERAIYMVLDEFLLSKGMPLELGRHQNSENIIHYHIQTPARVLSYIYNNQEIEPVASEFRSWLSKSILHNNQVKSKTRLEKVRSSYDEYKKDPSDYNHQKYTNWMRKYDETENENTDISEIIAGKKVSGLTYSKYMNRYIEKLKKDKRKEVENCGLFAKVKGNTEKYLDTFGCLDGIKKRYAQVLNQLLIEEGILLPGKELYTYVESTRDFITIKEGIMWNLPDVKRLEINREIKKIFKSDIDFEKELRKEKEGKSKKKIREKSRTLVHVLKKKIEKSIDRHKKTIAFDDEALSDFVRFWIDKVEYTKSNYKRFISSLVKEEIFNFDWKLSKVKELEQDSNVVNEDGLIADIVVHSIQDNYTEIIDKYDVSVFEDIDEAEYFDYYEEIEVGEIDKSAYKNSIEFNQDDMAIFELEDGENMSAYEQLEHQFEVELERLNYALDIDSDTVSVFVEGFECRFNSFDFEYIMNIAIHKYEDDRLEQAIADHYGLTIDSYEYELER